MRVCTKHKPTTVAATTTSRPPIEQSEEDRNNEHDGIRLNKVLKASHSRREADAVIASGRLTVNGLPNTGAGQRVLPYIDVVELDGKRVVGWEKMNGIADDNDVLSKNASKNRAGKSKLKHAGVSDASSHFEYVKYWKPRGVICTTDLRIKGNIIHALDRNGFRPKHRIYPVGRLDKDSTGATGSTWTEFYILSSTF